MCAERVAIFTAVAAGVQELDAVAVHCRHGRPDQPGSLMPCGACRQVMQQFVVPRARIVVDGVGELVMTDLLPLPFRLA